MNNLRQQVRDLLNEWDPINVVAEDERTTDHEYDGYIDGVIRLIRHGADAYKIRKHLEYTAKANIGVSYLPRNTDNIAERLVELTEQ